MKNIVTNKTQLRLLVLSIVIFVVYIIRDYQIGQRKAQIFYESAFRSTVINSKIRHGRTVEFELDNKQNIYFFPPVGNKLKIGDVVIKKANTSKYDVLRNNENSELQFIKTYERKKIE